MQAQSGPTFGDRLFAVIRSDIGVGALPAGAILPGVERVASELFIGADDVRAAYAHLLAEGLIAQRKDGELYIPAPGGGDGNESVGDATQIRFEATLLKAVREAAARGLTATEAAGQLRTGGLRRRDRGDDQ
jgi:DNA-binding transcriptional regulator YhcF (GntR family)